MVTLQKKTKKQKKVVALGPNLKFKRYHKNDIRFVTYKIGKTNLKRFDFGLKALEAGRLTPKQLETTRRACVRRLQHKKDKFIAHNTPCWPVTKKAKGLRMGKGKGAVHYYTSPVNGGAVLYQLDNKGGSSHSLHILKKMQKVLPVRTKLLISKNFNQEGFFREKNIKNF
jgi:large subunit ribosomal protein L16